MNIKYITVQYCNQGGCSNALNTCNFWKLQVFTVRPWSPYLTRYFCSMNQAEKTLTIIPVLETYPDYATEVSCYSEHKRILYACKFWHFYVKVLVKQIDNFSSHWNSCLRYKKISKIKNNYFPKMFTFQIAKHLPLDLKIHISNHKFIFANI